MRLNGVLSIITKKYCPGTAVLVGLFCFCALPLTREEAPNSIFDTNVSLTVYAETFPEYEWNDDAKKAYSLYLKSVNDYYFKKNYATAVILFYDAIDIYPYDARFYVRLSESQARTGDVQRALNTLKEAGNILTGFTSVPGINSYLNELTRALQSPPAEKAEEPKGIVAKTVGIVTWIPRKILHFITGLF